MIKRFLGRSSGAVVGAVGLIAAGHSMATPLRAAEINRALGVFR